VTGGYAAPQAAIKANTPLSRRWPRHGTSPQRSNERQRSDVLRTRKRDCHLGTSCSPSGPVSVRTTGLVSISVDDEVRRRGTTKKQAEVEGALEVSKDVLHDHEMGLTRVVHVEAHLLDLVGNVETSESEVLESQNQAAVGS
jgi:hypothetical protein